MYIIAPGIPLNRLPLGKTGYKLLVERGEFAIMVGSSSADLQTVALAVR
jgi:hypothetical protein